MKKSYLIIALLTLVACGESTSVTSTISSENVATSSITTSNATSLQTSQATTVNVTSNANTNQNSQIILKLTKYGLYNGKIGLSSESLFLENYITLNLKIGDELPTKDEITSSQSGLEFVAWQYVNADKSLDYTDKVIANVTTYQAYFKSNNEGDVVDPTPLPTGERTIYFISNASWESGIKQTNAYVWNASGNKKAWPGEAMTFVENVGTGKKYSYTFDSAYNYIIFCRTTDGKEFSNDGANQTSDISIPSNYNTATINSGLKTVTWSNT